MRKAIKIDPESLKLLNETLNLVQEDKRAEYIRQFSNLVENNYYDAKKYSETHNVDFQVAYDKVRSSGNHDNRKLNQFCIHGC